VILGFDIGGTKILALGLDERGKVLAELRRPTPQDPQALVEELTSMAAVLATEPVVAAGVGVAGLIGREGIIRISPHLPLLAGLDLAGELSRALAVRVTIDNDANAAAWGEAKHGAGRGVDDVVLVSLGTGIGTGLVVGGRLLRGAHGFAGEGGHMIVDRGGPKHVTGLRGSWEYFGSGSSLGVLARDLGLGESGEVLAGRVAAGERAALHALDRYAHDVAVGVANLVDVVDPALVILGGGVSAIGEPLRVAVQQHMLELVIGASYRTQLRVVLAQLGERAGAIGAALIGAGDRRIEGTPEATRRES
jgi:glucokinase